MVVGSQATSSTGIQLRLLAISTDYRGNAFAKLFEKSLAAITGVSLLPIIFTHADPTMTPSASAPASIIIGVQADSNHYYTLSFS